MLLVHSIGAKHVVQETVAAEEEVVDESIPSSSTDVTDAVPVIVFILFSAPSVASAPLPRLVIVPDDQIVVPRRLGISVDLVDRTVDQFVVLVEDSSR